MNASGTAARFARLLRKGAGSLGLIMLTLTARLAAAQNAADSSVTLTNVQQVLEFGTERARVEHPPVRLEAVVTFLTRREDEMFIHDAAAGLVVRHTNVLANRVAGHRPRPPHPPPRALRSGKNPGPRADRCAH